MRRLWSEHGGNHDAVVRAFAEAERNGEVVRRSNVRGTNSVAYAKRLLADGLRKGWILRGPSARVNGGASGKM
jgi:hypothetical protein